MMTKCFLLKIVIKARESILTTSIQHHMGDSSHCERERRRNKALHTGRGKLSFLRDDIVYVKNPMESKKKATKINK